MLGWRRPEARAAAAEHAAAEKEAAAAKEVAAMAEKLATAEKEAQETKQNGSEAHAVHEDSTRKGKEAELEKQKKTPPSSPLSRATTTEAGPPADEWSAVRAELDASFGRSAPPPSPVRARRTRRRERRRRRRARREKDAIGLNSTRALGRSDRRRSRGRARFAADESPEAPAAAPAAAPAGGGGGGGRGGGGSRGERRRAGRRRRLRGHKHAGRIVGFLGGGDDAPQQAHEGICGVDAAEHQRRRPARSARVACAARRRHAAAATTDGRPQHAFRPLRFGRAARGGVRDPEAVNDMATKALWAQGIVARNAPTILEPNVPGSSLSSSAGR